MRLVSLAICLAGSLNAELPDFYGKLPDMYWVVDDAASVAAAWRRAGVPSHGTDEPLKAADVKFRGRMVSHSFRQLSAEFANVRAFWIQPLSGTSAWSEFLRSHGSGIFALAYRVPSSETLEAEAARLQSLGVPILERGTIGVGKGRSVQYVFMDTIAQGKYCLGLIYDAASESRFEQDRLAVTQFALAVRDLDSISTFWQRLGFPAFTFTHPDLTDKIYKGSPAGFEMRVGWQRHLSIPFEWIQPLKGPNIYDDHIAKHGEGFQHIAFSVHNIDEAISRWNSLGFPVTMSGGWGERNRPGSGRFAYHDMQAAGGVDIELLWNYRSPAVPPATNRNR